jgi:hypothetical protein
VRELPSILQKPEGGIMIQASEASFIAVKE